MFQLYIYCVILGIKQEITNPSSNNTLKIKLLRFKEGLNHLFHNVYSLLGHWNLQSLGAA